MKQKIKKFREDHKHITYREIFKHSITNFVYGLLGASILVSVKIGLDAAVFLAYFTYYLFMSKVINRPAYQTYLGKNIVFPLSSCAGAFAGYKLAPYLIDILLFLIYGITI